MTPYEEYDAESIEEYRAFREKQKQIAKENKRKAKEKRRKARELLGIIRKWRKENKVEGGGKKVFEEENKLYKATLEVKEREKIDFEGVSIKDVLHRPKKVDKGF